MDYDKYNKVITDAMRRGEQVIDNFWNVLDHPDFPFLTLTSITNGVRNFPPYNIIESEDGQVRLEMAVAGYTKDRISVEKIANCLVIVGKPAETNHKEHLRHRTIANAEFKRVWELKASTDISDVTLKDGILTVRLTNTKPVEPPKITSQIK
jgi:molecular chaperone IbpA